MTRKERVKWNCFEGQMKRLSFGLIFFAFSLIICINGYAQNEPKWIAFNPDFPKDYIDINSITPPNNGVVIFWERAGDRIRKNAEGKTIYPTYTLNEMNCRLKEVRVLKWEMALEDQNTQEGIKARADFLKHTATLQKSYPSAWESIEPNKHCYMRYNFVCKESQKREIKR